MDTIELRNWLKEKDAINKTFKSFWVCFDNYLNEDRDEFNKYFGQYDKKKLKVYFSKVALKIVSLKYLDPENEDREFIEVFLKIEYTGEYIGYYSLLFDFNGETFDDFLVSEWKKRYIFNRLVILYELRDELLDEINIDDIFKEKMTNLIIEKISEARRRIITTE